ncbi:MAG TPA: protein kinase [Ktedonobacterales bacterium]|nr:protein kinase [Ktedonobacterales bacterium]
MAMYAPQAQAAQGGSPQPPALPPGARLLNRFVIEGYIGGGGFGHIYRARDLVFDYHRAIKEAFYRDPGSQQQFHYEAEFLINARHPNLVQAYLVFSAGGRLYLVMDYVDGKTLEDIAIELIRRTGRTPTEAQVIDWVSPICDAVHTLHTQPRPIIHRDIKPANIKLSESRGIPILIDLGLAKLYRHGHQTQAAALAFTPGYAPPEQYQATGATDQRTDVYGMGATLFFLLTGYQPTEAPARLSAQAQPAPRALNPALTPAIEQVVLKAMELDPRRRYQSMRELEQALLACREALAVPLIESVLPAHGERPHEHQSENDAIAAPAAGEHVSQSEAEVMRRPAANPIFEAGATDALQLGANATNPARSLPADLSSADKPPAEPDLSQIMAHLPSRPVAHAASPDQPPATPSPAASMEARPAHDAPSAYQAATGAADQPEASWAGWRNGSNIIGRLAAEPPTKRESVGVFAAFIALVCLALSFTALFAHPMALFLAPSLGLASLSLLALHDANGSREFWWLALSALGMGALWLVIWSLVWLTWLH